LGHRTFLLQEVLVMTLVRARTMLGFAALGACLLVAAVALIWRGPSIAAAQPATGTVTGRVLWGSCVRIPLPMTPDMPQPGAPDTGTVQPDGGNAPGVIRPLPQRVVPAGAVLVAVQNSAISGRTDEAGRFTLSSVPAGQYLTVAAGPVANAVEATAERPNVFLDGGQKIDIGSLVLGGSAFNGGIGCRFPLGPSTDAVPSEVPGAP
jgi:hypothetical protein